MVFKGRGDRATAETFPGTIEDRILTGCHGPLARVEADLDLVVSPLARDAIDVGLPVPRLYGATQFLTGIELRGFSGNPVHIPGPQAMRP